MFVRCAFFEGDVAPADREQFERIVREQVGPAMLAFPRIRELRFLWGREHETPERSVYLVIEHGYDSLDDIAAAITSDARRSMQGALDEMMALFDGRVWHANFEAASPSPE